MKFTRKAEASWKGSGKEGKGLMSTESTVLKDAQYSFNTRFEDGKGTNPEELIAAAHSGCFTMQLSFLLDEEGYSEKDLNTDAKLTFEDGEVSQIHLGLTGKVNGIDKAAFEKTAQKAKEMCPISKLLNTKITLSISLES
jgi:osmotically inducible protein OsmC